MREGGNLRPARPEISTTRWQAEIPCRGARGITAPRFETASSSSRLRLFGPTDPMQPEESESACSARQFDRGTPKALRGLALPHSDTGRFPQVVHFRGECHGARVNDTRPRRSSLLARRETVSQIRRRPLRSRCARLPFTMRLRICVIDRGEMKIIRLWRLNGTPRL